MYFHSNTSKALSSLSKFGVVLAIFLSGSVNTPAMANDQDPTPLSPAVIQPLVAQDGYALRLLPMNPTFRNYLQDVGADRPNFYTTKSNVSADGKVWVAYEVFGVTLDDSQTGGVKINVKFSDINQAKVPPETLLFSVFDMAQNQVVLGQAMSLQSFINHPNNSWLSGHLRKVFGNDLYSKFLDRLVAKGAHKKSVIVREYEVFPEKPLGFLIDFDKGDNFMPLAVRVSVGTNKEDLDHLFVKSATGQYIYQTATELPWYRRYKSILILVFLIAIFIGARTWIARR